MSRVIDSWQGAPIEAVTRHWGSPTTRTRQDGQAVYEWVTASTFHMPSTPAASVSPAQSFILHCTRQLVVDERGRVSGGSWRGDNCCGVGADRCAAWSNPAGR